MSEAKSLTPEEEKEIQRLEHRIQKQRLRRLQNERELDRLRRQLSLSRGDTSHIERDIGRIEADLASSESKEQDFMARIRKIRGEDVAEDAPTSLETAPSGPPKAPAA